MSRLEILDVHTEGHSIIVEYAASGKIADYFKEAHGRFTTTYDLECTSLPTGIAVLPFVANVLPIAWVTDSLLVIPSIDKSFADSIPQIKQAYADMYPNTSFAGKIQVQCTEDNRREDANGSLLFYSGGIDSACSLVRHMDEHPMLVTLKGADVSLDNDDGWNRVQQLVLDTAAEHHLETAFVSSEFRAFCNEEALNALVVSAGDFWWHGFQHGMGIIAHAAPIAYMTKKRTLYFASSFNITDTNVKCASYPTIDESIHFASCDVVHDGFELTRQDKVHAIVAWSQRHEHPISLRVCWASEDGKNCCHCEKCCRSIMALYAEGENPRDYGFDYESIDTIAEELKHCLIDALLLYPFWIEILSVMQKNYTENEIPESLQWLYRLHCEDLRIIGPVVKTAIAERDAQFAELHVWTNQLQASKDWLEEQYDRLSKQDNPPAQPKEEPCLLTKLASRAKSIALPHVRSLTPKQA